MDSGQSTFKSGSFFTIKNMLRQTVAGIYVATYKWLFSLWSDRRTVYVRQVRQVPNCKT